MQMFLDLLMFPTLIYSIAKESLSNSNKIETYGLEIETI